MPDGGYVAVADSKDYGDNGSPYFNLKWHDSPEYSDSVIGKIQCGSI